MNRNKGELYFLKSRILDCHESFFSLSEKTGIPLNALLEKLDGNSIFDLDECAVLCEVLGIPPQEIAKYFFNSTLRNAIYKEHGNEKDRDKEEMR